MDSLYQTMDRNCPTKERVFPSAKELIRAMGVEIIVRTTPSQFVTQEIDYEEVVGNPPDDAAMLLTNARVLVSSERLRYGGAALHEAIHHFCGPESLNDELVQMGFEFAVIGLVKDEKDRCDLFLDFAISGDGAGEIGSRIDELGDAYFQSKEWQGIIKRGQKFLTSKGAIRAPTLMRMKANS